MMMFNFQDIDFEETEVEEEEMENLDDYNDYVNSVIRYVEIIEDSDFDW
jgi:hypothetical protein